MSDYPSWSDEPAPSERQWSSGGGGSGGYSSGGGSYPPNYVPPPAMPPPSMNAHSFGAYGGAYSGSSTGSVPPPSDRPRFSEDGRGQPYSALLTKTGATVTNQDISYDTSSRDPAMLRARVFIGCIGRGPIVREDVIELCRPFGTLIAVTLFKGYAFVQFAEASSADSACEVLNGKRWKGVAIDVHLAMEGMVKKAIPQKRGANDTPTRTLSARASLNASAAGGTDPKRARNSAPSDNYSEVNDRNHAKASADNTTGSDIAQTELADTLICGTCRFVTTDFIAFRDHRKVICAKPKDPLEPPVLKCASCGLRFLSAWKLAFHLTDFHRMQLFKPEYNQEALEKAKQEDEKFQKVQEMRMQAFRTEEINKAKNGEGIDSTEADVSEENGENNDGTTATTDVPEHPPANDAPVERLTTGADYDEDEEDDDDSAPAPIPSLA